MATTSTAVETTRPIISISLPPLFPTTTAEDPTTTSEIEETDTTTDQATTTSTELPPTTTSEEESATTLPETTTSASEVLPPTTTSALETISTTSSSIPLTSTFLSTDSGGSTVTVVTVTQVAASSSSSAAESSVAATGGSSGFFSNKGAVAGVFTVAGIVAVALIAFFVSFIIRRRRASRLDRDFTLAAAAATPTAFLDEDPYGSSNRPSGAGGYSDGTSSHGTYAQYPMSTDSHQMSGPPPGAAFDYGGYGVAGVGAMQRARSQGPSADPYAAYANAGPYPPPPPPPPPADPSYYDAYRSPPAPDYPLYNGGRSSVSPEASQPDLARVTSQGSRSLLDPVSAGPTSAGGTTTESYASYYATPVTSANSGKGDLPPLPNPYVQKESGGGDEEDAEADAGGRKVLKVANE